MFLNRSILILLFFSLSFGSIEADHNASHKVKSGPKPLSAAKKTYQEIIEHNKKILKAYNDYEAKVGQVWGDEVVVPSAKVDVTYRNNLKERSVVNYEHGTVRVELAVRPEMANNAHSETKELAQAVEATILQGPDERSIIEMAKNPNSKGARSAALLHGLIANDDGTVLTPDELEQFKHNKAQAMKKRYITGKDGKKRLIISTKFEMVPDHIRKRAERYSKVVNHNALQHRIPTDLIYAIIETESYFNPTAKSPVPAFGLMQLVPQTGARDAYKFLYSKDILVKEKYLYNASNNIELGVAYLHLLYYKYLRHIKDPASRQWATIAAYNTGMKNVIETFVGKYTRAKHASRWSWKRKAILKMNKMKSEQLYKHLRKFLPYAETRGYMKKVRDNMGKYSA